MKIHNFSAGPAILPQVVLEEAAKAVENYENVGLSILEMSHRSKEIVAVMDEAQSLVKQLLNLGDDYSVLFLTGGASSQFFMVAMNLLNEGEKACYLDTGVWSTKAIKEVSNFGTVEVLASSKEDNFNYIPKDWTTPADAKYLHITSNNTIYGTQYQNFPTTESILVADMSSDIFSREFDASQFGLIYAGAQKNLGPAGTTLVIVRNDILGTVNRAIPTMLDYRTHIKKASAFNTPPVYPIYVCLLTLRWLQGQGGLKAVEAMNKKKAALLYDEIDRNPFFKGTAAVEDRSLMNVTFAADSPAHEAAFLAYCTANGVSGIKGHRSVGGFRASIYNAMPMESIEFLVNLMQNFKPE
ncbi:3-phosphoserine/phosphohydroxythreonine transaminase [Aureispira anguillae]|uniref:Phosphoserine aminotransferase n=1 Tax=Aureispira anguillae TaxID=2864201 RepID=A0A915YJJ8_9BACT|nr:3-phosphoserine/phosphohydroxythreonine transaminase [Aureispira anguillae]BDS14131.1 3-phosphoserine/phosphohydroxythreonine transaminase [Aureispira anguillae]